ncbi:MAG: nodulation protein NfeD [Desulfobacterales bacterium]
MKTSDSILILVLLLLQPIILSAAETNTDKTAQVLNIEGPIGPATASFVESGIETARLRNAEVVILSVDTPGGLAESMRIIIRMILSAPMPVVTYVSPPGSRAASAGTYILYASHIAAMAPGTNLGAATPIQIGGGSLPLPGKSPDKNDDTQGGKKNNKEPASHEESSGSMEKKIVNDAVAYIRSLAQLRGRNADWAEQSVREGASLPVNEALKMNVIDVVANNIADLLRKIDGLEITLDNRTITLKTAGLEIQTIEPGWRIKLLSIITNPNIAFILILIGIYGIIFEFSSPGSIGPGIIGVICLLFGLYALNVLPLNYAGLGLLIFAVALMVAEAFVPSFGILGISGLVAFILAATMLFDSDVPAFNISWSVIAIAAAISGGLLIFLLGYVLKAHRRPVITGSQGLIGKEGRVLTWSEGSGYVLIGGERWKAHGDKDLLPEDRVEINKRSGLEIEVKKKQSNQQVMRKDNP